MYTKSRWFYFYLENNKDYFLLYIHLANTAQNCFLSVFIFIVDLSPEETPYLDVSQPRVRWNKQPKT